MRMKGFRALFLAALAGLIAAGPLRAAPIELVGFGDSLMAGYQLPPADAFPARLEKALRDRGLDVSISNAGVSGDTTSGGLARIDWSVPDGTKGVILELGANDALRGIPPEESRKNLVAMIEKLKARGIGVLLVGMLAPPNMGGDYADRFNPIYPDLAKTYSIPLYAFFLDGVVQDAGLKIEDGMHPNPKGVGVMVERMLPVVETFVQGLPK
ncbi:(3S)-malyl-CoA thioesterase [Rhizobium sp. PP-F2F-G48]|uniref:arylesterase n=1 Tax=Rhizobium sp. PP-F2F-G48 TaxID=2135651 RepID=UPI0010D8B956|nr:arylesterase [Rhizobium sp. PP-F2F-G48]TCM55017.1 (3S)-malyl-CoA thioesterase [Rhizobium sp. PP-F2F-G48]